MIIFKSHISVPRQCIPLASEQAPDPSHHASPPPTKPPTLCRLYRHRPSLGGKKPQISKYLDNPDALQRTAKIHMDIYRDRHIAKPCQIWPKTLLNLDNSIQTLTCREDAFGHRISDERQGNPPLRNTRRFC